MPISIVCALLLISFISISAYDYIVIGSGTGGVVASRLAQNRNEVLLIEAGPDDLTYHCQFDNDTCIASPFGDLIAGTPLIPFKSGWYLSGVQAFKWQNTTSMPSYWNYNKTSLDRTNGLNRAKMLGGCSSHNGHMWTRGSARDFDYVAKRYNLSDWSFEKVLPFYRKAETYWGPNKTARGSDGPIHVQPTPLQDWQYQEHAFLNATIQSELNLPFNDNQNGDDFQRGIGFMEKNFAPYEDGTFGLFNTTHYRSASAQSYIRDIGLKSGYLTVWYNTTVQRILFDDSTAVGVEYYDQNTSTLRSVRCSKEVILSAGTYQSPQLLMLSGIGPSDELNRFNITPIYVNDYIGRYGQDHFYLNYYFRLNMSYFGNMTNSRDDTHTIHDIIRNRTEYFDVPGALSVYLSTGSYDRLGFDYNNIRLEVMGASDPTVGTFRVIIDPQVYSKNLTVKLTSLDSRIFPAVYQNFFSDSRDYDTAIEAVSAVRKIIANQSIFIDVIDDEYNMSSIEEWREFIWRRSGPAIHAVGTVPMGSELIYPVNEKCSVRGVHNLRVVDLSLWPESTNSGTQSLTYMLGEKCVQYIINDNRHTTSWWHENQNYIIIAIVAIIVLIVIGFIGYKCFYYKRYARQEDQATIPLIEHK